MPKSIGSWRTTYVTCMQSFVSVYLAVSEKTGGQTDKQTNRKTDKPTKQLEGYSRHSRQPSLNISYIQIRSLLIYIESKNSGYLAPLLRYRHATFCNHANILKDVFHIYF